MAENKATSIGNRGTQNIQRDYGKQVNDSGTQIQPKYNPQPAPATGIQVNKHGDNGTKNIQGDNGKQVNDSGTRGTQVNNHGNNGTQNIQGEYVNNANDSGIQNQPKYNFKYNLAAAPAPKGRSQQRQKSTTAEVNNGTQNIQGGYGTQANNSGTQNQPEYNFAAAPATKTSGTQQQRHPKHPTKVNNGTQNIQGEYGTQANNFGTQNQPGYKFAPSPRTSGTQQQLHSKHSTTAEVNNGTQNIQADYGTQANNSRIQYAPTFTFD